MSKYPFEILHLFAKCSLNLKIYIFFLILDSKDIKSKHLTVSFDTLNSTSIHVSTFI